MPKYPWLHIIGDGKATIDVSDLDLTRNDPNKVVVHYGDTPELSHRLHIATAINEGYVKLVDDDDA